MTTDLPSQGNNIVPTLTPELQGTPTGGSSSEPPRYRAISHAFALTTFVLPLFLLPYLLARRKLYSIHQRVDQLATTVQVLQRDLNKISSEFAVQKDGHRRLKSSVYSTMRETDELRAQAEQMERNRTMSGECISNDIKRLVDEAQSTRTQLALLRPLGMSLADIAAFMHEVKLEMGMNQGKDYHGIEKLRDLALRMESLPQQDKESKEEPRGESTSTRP